ncbi:MAG: S41 family peptidase [Balneolaceae bacterium]
MKNQSINITLTLISILFLFNACNNPSGNSDDPGEFIQVNSWVHANMEFYYYWNERVPEKADGYMTPENFFESMLEPQDIFSFISDDAESLLDDLNGSSFSAGFSPTFGRFSGTNNVFIIVEFIYPNTPAEAAGLKRGDIILEINGTQLTLDNYQDLYYDESDATYTMGIYNPEENTISNSGDTITVSKAELELDPVVYTDIIEVNTHKIGYLFYAQFLTGTNNKFIDSVDEILSEFEQAGVTELIVDLRYNPGGRVTAAENLANSIAPPSVTANNEVFVRYEYNDNLESYYTEKEGLDSPNLVALFSEDPTNLNLDRAYFLTTSGSASASELLINGLKPYMDVISIGTPTFGKFYGSYVLTGNQATPPNNYAIVPVTLKYANADGITDFRDGLQPDYEVEEDILQPKAIGDTTDALLAKALHLITGAAEPVAKIYPRFQYQKIQDPVKLRRGNVMFEKKGQPRLN